MAEYIGEFEQLVMLAIARLGDDAYGVTIQDVLKERANRAASLGAIYSTIRRLEAKGLLRTTLGEPEPVRGGRAKKFATLTRAGQSALRSSQRAFQSMAEGLDDFPVR